MNRENVLRVADAIERETVPGLGFDMDLYYSNQRPCGTTACIAGWACVLAGALDAKTGEWQGDRVVRRDIYPDTAKEWLGITDWQATELFYELNKTRAQAVATLRYLADTNEVKWELDQ